MIIKPVTVHPVDFLNEGFKESCLKTFGFMVSSRFLEDKLASLYRAGGRIFGGVYLGRGQEAFSASMATQLIPGKDVYGPLIRDQAGRMAFGEPILDTFRTYLGSVNGPMRGRDGNIHRGRPRQGMPAMISHLGSMVSVVAGMVMARRMKGVTDLVGATSIGEGGSSTGSFHEALNLAAVEKLPLVVALANNQFAYSTPTSQQFACDDLADRAFGYGIEGYSVDGTDLAACVQVFQTAVARARAGHGPQLVVGRLLRLCGHGEHDDASYVPEEIRKSEAGRDCLEKAREFLLERHWMTAHDIEQMEAAAEVEINDAVAMVSREPDPDPYTEDWCAISRKDLADS